MEVDDTQGFDHALYLFSSKKNTAKHTGLMRDRWGIKPDTVTYTAAISACERGANCSVALGLLDAMKVRTGQPGGTRGRLLCWSASASARRS